MIKDFETDTMLTQKELEEYKAKEVEKKNFRFNDLPIKNLGVKIMLTAAFIFLFGVGFFHPDWAWVNHFIAGLGFAIGLGLFYFDF